jgi:hypothetical protein
MDNITLYHPNIPFIITLLLVKGEGFAPRIMRAR